MRFRGKFMMFQINSDIDKIKFFCDSGKRVDGKIVQCDLPCFHGEVVKERIETVGKGGGLLISPTHVLEPDVPLENIIAFFKAVKQFGKY